jgi:predicted alpha/beta superfamily hydrolase
LTWVVPGGGADLFLDFVTGPLLDRLAGRHPLDSSDVSLLGNALGGLLALHALFRRPTAFRTFVAASPAIFWDDGAVLNGEAAFAARVSAGEVAPRVLITVGAREQSPDDYTTSARYLPDWTIERGRAEANRLRMVDNARELAARLAALPTRHGFEAAFAELAGETHSGVIAANVSRGLGFALRPGAS